MSAIPISPLDAPGLPARLAQFARLLRDNGYAVSAVETADALRYFADEGAAAGPPTERALRGGLRALYCASRRELDRFDELFDAYWNDRVGRKRTICRPNQTGGGGAVAKTPGSGGGRGGGLVRYFNWAEDPNDENAGGDAVGDDKDDGGSVGLGGASATRSSNRVDLGKATDPDEVARLMMLADRLGARMRFRMARRLRERRRGRRLSLRRTLRASVATGGLPVRLHRRLRRMPPVKLALFVDVSGSMDAYSAFFMRFVHALTGRFQQAEAFLFHTQLAHISGPLREADPVKMLEKMTLISQGWSGGTRIGAAIRDFNTHYADIAGGSRTVAVILSDGYDTGAPDELAAALHQLRARTHKVFWLNPMIGRDGYAPETRAMAAALPYLDLFAPAHNLESLEALEQALVRA